MGQNNIIDIDLSVTRKKRFRIDGDDSRIIELNTSDMNILLRLDEVEERLKTLADSVTFDDEGAEPEENIKRLLSTDKEMRDLMDYLFDSKISDICAPSGSMYDPFNGKYRFEHIMETLFTLYEENIEQEYKKMTTNVQKHTAKYTKPRSGKK